MKISKRSVSLWVILFGAFVVLFIIIPLSESYTVICSRGSYFSDGCSHCFCDPKTAATKCEKSLDKCSGSLGSVEEALAYEELGVSSKKSSKCPYGSTFKDRNGNACKCLDESGTVFCSILNFKKKVKPERPSEFSHRLSRPGPVNYPPVEVDRSITYVDLDADDDTSGDLSRDDYDTSGRSGSGSSSSSGSSSEEGAEKKKISLEKAKTLGLIERADVEDDKSDRISMLEYTGKSWGLRPTRLPFTQFRKQIDDVLASLGGL